MLCAEPDLVASTKTRGAAAALPPNDDSFSSDESSNVPSLPLAPDSPQLPGTVATSLSLAFPTECNAQEFRLPAEFKIPNIPKSEDFRIAVPVKVDEVKKSIAVKPEELRISNAGVDVVSVEQDVPNVQNVSSPSPTAPSSDSRNPEKSSASGTRCGYTGVPFSSQSLPASSEAPKAPVHPLSLAARQHKSHPALLHIALLDPLVPVTNSHAIRELLTTGATATAPPNGGLSTAHSEHTCDDIYLPLSVFNYLRNPNSLCNSLL